jgi:putative Holliday junction resolvase
MDKIQTLMGFDFGLRSIGVAIGQTVTRTATPLCAIKAIDGEPNWVELEKIVAEWRPEAFVVGIPLDMQGDALSVTNAAKQFAEKIHGHFQLPVYPAEERLTTKEARATLFEEKGFKGLLKADVDAISAQIILECWMQEER